MNVRAGFVFCIVLAHGGSGTAVAQDKPAPKVPANVVYCPDLAYVDTDKTKLMLDLARPAGDGVFPTVVILHGTGPLNKGRKHLLPVAFQLAQRGYVAATVSFRCKPDDVYPRPLEDVQTAVRWLRANAPKHHIDPDRLGALGYSGGATLACLLGMMDAPVNGKGDRPKSSKVQAVVAFYPSTDLARLHADIGKKNPVWGWLLRQNLETWLGGPPSKISARYADASPITHVSKDMAPLLLLHGTADDTVPIEQSQMLAARADEKHARVVFVSFSGAGHNFDERDDASTRLAVRMAQAFLDEHLRPAAKAGAP